MFGDGQATGAHARPLQRAARSAATPAPTAGACAPTAMTVASIDADTGKTVLFGLPRNMRNFPFPEGSMMDEQFPHGYDCDGLRAQQPGHLGRRPHEPVQAASHNPGVEATIEGVEGITGLKINYYAMVNLQGFEDLVDAVGGVTLNVRDRIPIGGVGAASPATSSRACASSTASRRCGSPARAIAADDYSRMARQKCVMNAMLQQLSPADRGHELREDRQGQRGADHHRPAAERARHRSRSSR